MTLEGRGYGKNFASLNNFHRDVDIRPPRITLGVEQASETIIKAPEWPDCARTCPQLMIIIKKQLNVLICASANRYIEEVATESTAN